MHSKTLILHSSILISLVPKGKLDFSFNQTMSENRHIVYKCFLDDKVILGSKTKMDGENKEKKTSELLQKREV